MRSRLVLVILLIIAIIVLACLMGPLIFNSYQNQKQESQLTITSNITQYRQDNFTVRLSDVNGNPIANEQINIVMLNESNSYDYTVVTDSNGVGTVNLEDREFGKYTFNCTFNGNGQYKPSNAIQRIDIVQKVIEAPTVVDANITVNATYQTNGTNGTGYYDADSYNYYSDSSSYGSYDSYDYSGSSYDSYGYYSDSSYDSYDYSSGETGY